MNWNQSSTSCKKRWLELNNENDESPARGFVIKALTHFNALMDVDKHYRRKEKPAVSLSGEKGITGPPTVMWGKHDEVREMLRNSIDSLKVSLDATSES